MAYLRHEGVCEVGVRALLVNVIHKQTLVGSALVGTIAEVVHNVVPHVDAACETTVGINSAAHTPTTALCVSEKVMVE